MTVEYYIVNPTGNITALVTSGNIGKEKEINDLIMKKHPEVEQVGFVDFTSENPKLRMAGGEFCGNATLSTASLFCEIFSYNNREVFVEVFGTENPVRVNVNKTSNGYKCDVFLKKPNKIYDYLFSVDGNTYSLPVVQFDGISHIIFDSDFDKSVAEKILRKYSKIFDCSAMGAMIFNSKNSTLIPIVYVKDCDVMFYEHSCASGSCAVCSYIASKNEKTASLSLSQPGGKLKVSISGDNPDVLLNGTALILDFYRSEFLI